MTLDCAAVLFAAFGVLGSATWLPPGLRGGIPPWGPAAPPASPPWLGAPQSVVFRRPMDAMVDLTNDLGVAILQDYSHARSNFAFSPYGLASVLVVLYEGAHGESARQIHLAAKFPWDRDITRIGFRDIHRHLRSYFSHEGYLSGITLNKDSSSLKTDYKKVLRFYGYDVDVDNLKPSKPVRPTGGERPMEEIPVLKPPEPKPATSPPGGNTFKWTTRIPTTIGSEVTLNQSLVPKETDDGVTEHSVVVIMSEDTAAAEQTTKPTMSTDSIATKSPVSESSVTSAVISEKSTEVPLVNEDASTPATSIAPSSPIVDSSTVSTTVEGTTKLPTSIMDNGMLIPDASLLPVTPTPAQVTDVQDTSTESIQGDRFSVFTTESSTSLMSETPLQPSTTHEAASSASQTQKINEIPDVSTSPSTAGISLETSTVEAEILSTENAKISTVPVNVILEMATDTQGRENGGIDAETVQTDSTPSLSFVTTDTGKLEIDIRVEEDQSEEVTEKEVTSTTERVSSLSNELFITSEIGESRPSTSSGEMTTVNPVTAQGTEQISKLVTEGTIPVMAATVETEVSPVVRDKNAESVSSEILSSESFVTEGLGPNTESTTQASDVIKIEEITENIAPAISTERTTEIREGIVTTEINTLSDVSTTLIELSSKMTEESTTDKNVVKRSPFPILLNPLSPWQIKTLEEYLLLTDIGKKPLQDPELALVSENDYLEPHTLDEFLMQKNIDWIALEPHEDAIGSDDFVPKTLEEFLLLRKSKNMKNNSPILSFQTEMDFTQQSRFHRHPRTISDILHIPAVPDLSLQLQNGMFDSHVSRKAELYRPLPRNPFLVDASVETPVPVMTYSNVFPFAYIPRLHSQALEFPLDDERYKLLIILPMERRGLRQLIYDLSAVSLRGVMDALRPTRVKATVPTFMVEGFVILTPALQRLGIWNVFDPRKANLSSMSSDPELYVRNVEQSVTVVIRNYVEILDIQTRTMAARGVEHEFKATHPFLYFVLDTETNVSLMAGQMLDPLNSRIY